MPRQLRPLPTRPPCSRLESCSPGLKLRLSVAVSSPGRNWRLAGISSLDPLGGRTPVCGEISRVASSPPWFVIPGFDEGAPPGCAFRFELGGTPPLVCEVVFCAAAPNAVQIKSIAPYTAMRFNVILELTRAAIIGAKYGLAQGEVFCA